MSEPWACSVVRLWRSVHRYRSCRDPDLALRQRLRELSATRVRFGCRSLLPLLRRDGWQVGKSRLYRLYCEEGLALRRKRPRRHVANGRRFRSLTVIDLYTRECLAIELGHTLRAVDVVRTLEALRFEHGLPQRIYCDNGSEFVQRAVPGRVPECTRVRID